MVHSRRQKAIKKVQLLTEHGHTDTFSQREREKKPMNGNEREMQRGRERPNVKGNEVKKKDCLKLIIHEERR